MIPFTYHGVVRGRVRKVFELISRNDWQTVLSDSAEDVHHIFPGDHPLGGERHSRDAVAEWSRRLERLFPGHEFKVERVAVSGWPWRTHVAVGWTALLEPRVGASYVNVGAHWLEIRWGKVTYIRAYLDSQAVARACATMAEAGVDEAAAAPITATSDGVPRHPSDGGCSSRAA